MDLSQYNALSQGIVRELWDRANSQIRTREDKVNLFMNMYRGAIRLQGTARVIAKDDCFLVQCSIGTRAYTLTLPIETVVEWYTGNMLPDYLKAQLYKQYSKVLTDSEIQRLTEATSAELTKFIEAVA